MSKYLFKDIVLGDEGLLKGPFGSDLKKSLYVPKGDDTYKVYLQENILKEDNTVGDHYISKQYYNEKMSRYEVKENDFIVTCDGTLGEIFQLKNITEKGIISSSLLRITLNNEIVDDDYFYYLFKALIKKELITQGNNSVLKHLPGLNVIRNHPIYLPDLYKQKRIGRILKLIDTKIRNNSKINSELESMAKTIYDYWFLQFEFPNEDGKPYKSSGGKMAWNEELKREIPEGWEVKKIRDIENNIVTGKTPSTKDSSNYGSEIPFITIGDIRGNMYVVKTEQMLSNKGADSQKNKFIPKGSICVTCIATPGLVGLSTEDSQTNQQINSIIIKNESNRMFLYFAIKDYFDNAKAKIGNTFANMNKGEFSEIEVIYPKKEVLNIFSEKVSAISKDILRNSLESKELIELRDFLLPLLMNGQVTFKEDIGDEISNKDIEEKELLTK